MLPTSRRFLTTRCDQTSHLFSPRMQPIRNYSSSVSSGMNDLVVIGGGPGGYVAAIKAAQLGMKVSCIEKRGTLGGTCLNVGCIPSKALLHSSHLYEQTKHYMPSRGILIDNPRVDLSEMMKTKETEVRGLTMGIEQLFKKNKVNYIKGSGRFIGSNRIEVVDGADQVIESVIAKNVIIATGSEPTSLPSIPIDEKSIVTSTGALSLTKVPKNLVVIGGGIIGLELGSVWSRLGSQVTIIEYSNGICSGSDGEVAKQFKRILEKQGMKFIMRTSVKGAQVQSDGSVKITAEDLSSKQVITIDCDVVLVSVGRKPYTQGLGLEKIGVKVDHRGVIETNDHFQTSVPHVYAIGDVIKGPMLAHKAEEEGIALVESLASPGSGHVNYDAIPSVVYTSPEVAWVGKNEEQLKADGIQYKVGSFPFKANSRARTNGETDGFVKFLSARESDLILGVHMIGVNAGELIAEAVLAIEYGASSEDIARTCHAHPTLSEAVKEAAMSAYNKPIHF